MEHNGAVPTAGVPVDDRVMAVVLTFDAPDAARPCLAAIRAQSVPVQTILVVDNASDPPFDARAAGAGVQVLRLEENAGPAGGYAAGLEAFLRSGLGWVWLVDDDSTPRVDALERQLHAAHQHADPTAWLATMIDRDSGEVANTHGWCGVLIPRVIVDAVGVPNAELFWWSEDTEYLQWRIPEAGFALGRCGDAVVEVSRRRATRAKPAWKFYYEARNQVYHRIHVQRQTPGGPSRRHLTARVRWWRATRSVVKLGARALLREPDGRGRKLGMVARGTVDGLRGRLGKTVPVDTSDRPAPPGPTTRIVLADGSSVGRVETQEPFDLDESRRPRPGRLD
ncbi:MAG: hypothetical protein AMXMBFR46_16120 [Acidimicrobiia bacterium]